VELLFFKRFLKENSARRPAVYANKIPNEDLLSMQRKVSMKAYRLCKENSAWRPTVYAKKIHREDLPSMQRNKWRRKLGTMSYLYVCLVERNYILNRKYSLRIIERILAVTFRNLWTYVLGDRPFVIINFNTLVATSRDISTKLRGTTWLGHRCPPFMLHDSSV
jgi:hypothetical protein